MTKVLHHIFESESALATEDFAARLASRLGGGEVIELNGDVGAGKTTFVRGLARGIGSKDQVSSPTFTISNVYSGRLALCHYDLYRLHEDALIKSELAELLHDKKNVVVLEWATQARSVLPDNHISITFTVSGELGRTLTLAIPADYNYMEIS